VPPKERLRSDHERGPPVPRERSARRGEERPIPVAKLRPADRPPQHPRLVAEHGVLELELRHARLSGEESDEANEDGIGEGSQGATDATYQRQRERTEFSTPTRVRRTLLA
jgi:hypothetical protein